MFPANLYYNQTAPLTDGGVMLTVFWPDFDAAPLGDRPVRSSQDSRRQVLVELRYIDRVPIQNYLARRSSSEATSAPGSLERRDPVENLALRVAQPERWGLTPYAIDPSLMAAYAKDGGCAGQALRAQPRNGTRLVCGPLGGGPTDNVHQLRPGRSDS
ncbi:hypothetical protein [Stenotrophomonas sp. PE591]|uniref:hypothetical protein n=1 Tax=Stenotrophomonas sp. PE591 TaxID=1812490 RepID=UPI0020167481|nr:hypothetical protein [Stenotrophomonas sp. PE591]